MSVVSDSLAGRRILITGATSGIGEATATAITAAGGAVALVARSADRLDALAEMLGDGAVSCPADVTDAGATGAAVADAASALGGLDGVVCSAGLVRPGGVAETSPDDWRAMYEVNVLGVLHTVAAALPHLRRAGHSDVVNVSSMSGRRRASVELGVYASTKFAVHVLSDSMREELAADGVRVSIIAPGYVRTPIFDGLADPEMRAGYQAALAAKGLDAGDVAAQIVHALAQPPGVNVIEIAMMSTNQ